MDDLIKLFKNNTAIEALLSGQRQFVTDDTVGVALLIATSFHKKPQKYNIITSNLYNAQKMYDLLSTLIGENNCLFYPVDEMMRVNYVAESKEMLSQRLYVLGKLQEKDNFVLITHAAAVMKYMPSPDLFYKYVLYFEVDKTYDIKQIEKLLSECGYTRVHKIDNSLQYAIRGDILDIYSANNDYPVRIEFYDDVIESIRFFDISTQESIKNLKCVKILPSNEYLLDEDEISQMRQKVDEQYKKDMKQLIIEKQNLFSENISYLKDNLPNLSNKLMHKYYGFFQNSHFSILDYAKSAITFIANKEQLQVSNNTLLKESCDYLYSQFEEGLILSHLEIYRDINAVLKNNGNLYFATELVGREKSINFKIRPNSVVAFSLPQALELIKENISNGKKVIIALKSKQQLDIMKNMLINENIPFVYSDEFKISNDSLLLCSSILEEGFEIVDENVIVLGAKELFNYKVTSTKFTKRYKEAVILKSENDLHPGDYVVHETRGIGRFVDIQTLLVDGIHRDFLHIQYAGSDVLYIPLEQFKLVRKFVGKEGAVPKLTRLGSNEWENTKKKIKNRINDMADKLYSLYLERQKVKGFAFLPDDEIQMEFENMFPFELTKDQKECMQEIKEDMEKDVPMDRLLCGDVGFGKTELAFRAAFKAILSGKQVALLCPTTLLCRQHYERACERFMPFGVRLAVFSRLIDENTQKHNMEELAKGNINLVIGTHRLLSKKIIFKDLGLLIIDEEQRFGVAQKERIKEMKKNVDVLTLTATPIPRTLQMSLLGIRQLSQINTSPENRMPVQTYVIPKDNEVTKELMERELAREGQVFYLYNKVSTIYEVAKRIEKSIKFAKVGVVHGQMDRNEIEDVMLRFYSNEINILVCTSIIETGIDIPNVNMIIIEDADKFGLSQLYQIKGRVGRGSRIAYAYLLYNPQKNMNENARKRLKAIQDFTELGSGYKIAQRDLLIRGAGDILGPEQAGFIDTVGIDMYIQLLNEAIEEKKTGVIKTAEGHNSTINIDAYLPSEYIQESDKIEIYQEIEKINNYEDLEKFQNKISDIYGRLPDASKRLIKKKKLEIMVSNQSIFKSVKESSDFVEILLSSRISEMNGVGQILFKALTRYLRDIKVMFISRAISIKVRKRESWFDELYQIIEIIYKLFID